MTKKKTKTFLKPDQRRSLAAAYHSGRFTADELTEKYNVSKSVVYNCAKEYPPAAPSSDGATLIAFGARLGELQREAAALGYTLTLTKGAA